LAPGQPIRATIRVPGSKSVTNRALLIAALADGNSTLENALVSEDSTHMVTSLRRLGFAVERTDHDPATATFDIIGESGHIPTAEADLFVGNSGTTARFLTAAIGLGKGVYHIDGVPRMRERPISPLLDALQPLLPADAHIDSDDGKFPLTIYADGLQGGLTRLDASASSQFLSALLLVAPYADAPVQIELSGALVSEPYIETTIRMMAQFGIVVDRPSQRLFRLPNSHYQGQRYAVEPDASNATYFFAAAAVSGGIVTVPYLTRDSLQGDLHFLDVLAQMGCTVTYSAVGVTVRGPSQLHGIDVDMNAISDTAQTLAAIAPFADGPVTIRNIAHVRHKETDRITALVTELRRLGVQVEEFTDGLRIQPGGMHGATVQTYQDHRMAMAFAVAGLRTPGVVIADPDCTHKTFPDFFDRFAKLYEADTNGGLS
jgi:3-phosphoshikimate 1-carboxyvinyltransferase